MNPGGRASCYSHEFPRGAHKKVLYAPSGEHHGVAQIQVKRKTKKVKEVGVCSQDERREGWQKDRKEPGPIHTGTVGYGAGWAWVPTFRHSPAHTHPHSAI